MRVLKNLFYIPTVICNMVPKRYASNSSLSDFASNSSFVSASNSSLPVLTLDDSVPYTISVEGNIASGKTTLLNHFSQNKDIHVVAEPVDKWQNLEGENLFKIYYANPNRWSFAFQNYVQLTMLQNHLKRKENTIIKFLERSLHSAKNIFVENLYQCGAMEKCEYTIINDWYNWFLENELVSCDLIVYLRTDPDIIFGRIQKRCRNEEKMIAKEYVISLHRLYEKWLFKKAEDDVDPSSKIVIIDGNVSKEDMITKYDDLFATNILPIIEDRKHLVDQIRSKFKLNTPNH